MVEWKKDSNSLMIRGARKTEYDAKLGDLSLSKSAVALSKASVRLLRKRPGAPK